jgi:hypothetical protein
MGIRVQISDDHASIRGEVQGVEGVVKGGVVYHVKGRREVNHEGVKVQTCESGVLQGTGDELKLLGGVPLLPETFLLGGE